MRSEPQGRAYTGLPSHGKPLSSAAHTPLFTLLSDKRDRRRTEMQPVFPQHEASMMEDFIERTLRERRSLPDALADMLAKYNRIPTGTERSMLERMIGVLKCEIALRQNSPRPAE